MKAVVDCERLANRQTILAHLDIPSVTAIEAIDAGHPIFKITTAGRAFLLKDISHAPNLSRLDFMRAVFLHAA